jgi:DNA-binding XRE family transcriptional regulator
MQGQYREYAFTLPQLHRRALKRQRASQYERKSRDNLIPESIHYRLYNLRLDHGLTLEQLGNKLGASASMLCQIETGKHNPSLRMIQRLADYYDMTLSELFEGVAIIVHPD